MHARKGLAEGAAVAAAAVAVAVTYGIYAVHPWQESTPLNQFLAAFGRADTAAWPMQIVWYLAALAMVGLALWLCVPRTLSTSCDQPVFVDHAADASVSPDVVLLKVDRFG